MCIDTRVSYHCTTEALQIKGTACGVFSIFFARLPSSATLDRCSLTDICLLALSLACRRQPHSIVVHSQTFVFPLRCRSPAVVSHTRSLFAHRHSSSSCAVARLPSSATLDRCSLTDICLLALSLVCRRQPSSATLNRCSLTDTQYSLMKF